MILQRDPGRITRAFGKQSKFLYKLKTKCFLEEGESLLYPIPLASCQIITRAGTLLRISKKEEKSLAEKTIRKAPPFAPRARTFGYYRCSQGFSSIFRFAFFIKKQLRLPVLSSLQGLKQNVFCSGLCRTCYVKCFMQNVFYIEYVLCRTRLL